MLSSVRETRLGPGWSTVSSRHRQPSAEREGFEPSGPVSQANSLAVSPIRPLSHLSLTTMLTGDAYVCCDAMGPGQRWYSGRSQGYLGGIPEPLNGPPGLASSRLG